MRYKKRQNKDHQDTNKKNQRMKEANNDRDKQNTASRRQNAKPSSGGGKQSRRFEQT
jgi:hypothetical protein